MATDPQQTFQNAQRTLFAFSRQLSATVQTIAAKDRDVKRANLTCKELQAVLQKEERKTYKQVGRM